MRCSCQAVGRAVRRRHAELSEVEAVISALEPTLETGMPFAFFGHSFGALVAAETARALAARERPVPLMLLLSAHQAPTAALGEEQAALSRLPSDEALLEALKLWDFAPDALSGGAADVETPGGAPAASPAVDPSLLAVTMPPIRADLAMREAPSARRRRRRRRRRLAAAAAAVPSPPLAATPTARAPRRPRRVGPPRAHRPQGGGLLDGGARGRPLGLEDAAPRAALLDRLAARPPPPADAPVPAVAGPALPPPPPAEWPRAAEAASVVDGAAAAAAAVAWPYAHEMFERCAEVTPHATAIIEAAGEGGGGSGGGSGSGGDDAAVVRHSYADVRAAASGLAEWLRLHGAHPKTTVAMLLHHCASFLIGQLAIAMTGAACFALEGHFGPAMMRDLMADTSPLAGLAASKLAPRLEDALSSGGSAAGAPHRPC